MVLSDAVLIQLILAIGGVLTVLVGGMIKLFTRTKELRLEADKYKADARKAQNDAESAVEVYKQTLWEKLEEQRQKLYKDIDEKRETRISELRESVHDWRDRTHVAEGQLVILRKEKEEISQKLWTSEQRAIHLDQRVQDLLGEIADLKNRLEES
jgi:hypothetical protein